MPYRRHSARMFEPSCLASITNSRRNDMADISPHGIHPLPHELRDAWKMCSPCPRTPVHHVSGLYTLPRKGGGYASLGQRDQIFRPQSEYTYFRTLGSSTSVLSMTVKPVPIRVGIDWPVRWA